MICSVEALMIFYENVQIIFFLWLLLMNIRGKKEPCGTSVLNSIYHSSRWHKKKGQCCRINDYLLFFFYVFRHLETPLDTKKNNKKIKKLKIKFVDRYKFVINIVIFVICFSSCVYVCVYCSGKHLHRLPKSMINIWKLYVYFIKINYLHVEQNITLLLDLLKHFFISRFTLITFPSVATQRTCLPTDGCTGMCLRDTHDTEQKDLPQR